MKWFKNIKTRQELRKKYRDLCKQFHPDVNPNTDGSEVFNNTSTRNKSLK